MGLFWNKKLNSDEYLILSKKQTELFALAEELKVSNAKLQTDIANLRGRFNQRIGGGTENKSKSGTTSTTPTIFLSEDGESID